MLTAPGGPLLNELNEQIVAVHAPGPGREDGTILTLPQETRNTSCSSEISSPLITWRVCNCGQYVGRPGRTAMVENSCHGIASAQLIRRNPAMPPWRDSAPRVRGMLARPRGFAQPKLAASPAPTRAVYCQPGASRRPTCRKSARHQTRNVYGEQPFAGKLGCVEAT